MILMFFLVAALSTGIGIAQEWIKSNQRLKAIEAEKLNAELNGLKSQINPHFLFNSLNTIYALTLTDTAQANTAVLKLSEMMRYVLEDAQVELVTLNKEIEHLQNYIAFQQLRANENLKVNFLIENNSTSDTKVAPLILISFIENAFKYGVSAHELSVIDIQLYVDSSHVHFSVKNKVFPTLSTLGREKGIGLENTKRRLELIYPARHSLIIENLNRNYRVDLKINLS